MKKTEESPTKERIVLIGYRGVGKSVIGKILSEMLGWEYIATDQLIEKKCGLSINQLVETEGWEKFRLLETEIIRSLREVFRVVIDCGGGVIENETNMQSLRERSAVIWIDAQQEVIFRRLSRATNRPPLFSADLKKDIETTYSRRLSLYRKYSDFYVENSQGTPEEKCSQIIEQVFGNQEFRQGT